MKKRERTKRKVLKREGVRVLGITKGRESDRYQNRIALHKELAFLLAFWYMYQNCSQTKISSFWREAQMIIIFPNPSSTGVMNYDPNGSDLSGALRGRSPRPINIIGSYTS